jgi:amino acid adenylation domain-containing protein/non-ribosomal peptide synthase protein (TIGR01720 family)
MGDAVEPTDVSVLDVPCAEWAPWSAGAGRAELVSRLVRAWAAACVLERGGCEIVIGSGDWQVAFRAVDAREVRGQAVEALRGREFSAADVLRCGLVAEAEGPAAGVPVVSACAAALDGAGVLRLTSRGRLADAVLGIAAARIADLAAAPDEPALPGPRERAVLLSDDWAGPGTGPEPADVVALFTAQARATPAAPAVEFDGTSLTYDELDRLSDRLAARIADAGTGPDELVAICLDRGIDSVIALLAVLKAGGAYVPVDPRLPRLRQERLIQAAGAGLMLVAAEPHEPRLVVLDGRRPPQVRRPAGAPDSLAYVLFTSGSTGAPKAVATPRRSLNHLVQWYVSHSGAPVDGRALHFSALSWDTSTAEIFPTLCSGGCVVIATAEQRQDPDALLALLHKRHVERMVLPPQMLNHLAEASAARNLVPDNLLDVAAGGERFVLNPTLRAWLADIGCTVQNHYGPTETQLVTAYAASAVGDVPEVVPIGRACGDTRLYVLDDDLRPVGVGVSGELHIGGLGVARGYLGQPGATASRFLPDPYGPPGGRIYRSGDVVRWLPDGNLQFLGRSDDQVKVRGHRVELGEIEAQLAAHPAVGRVAVVAVEDGRGSHAVEAFVVPAAAVDAAVLRAHLVERLPDYMVPARIAVVDDIPLTANGKADVPALTAMRTRTDAVSQAPADGAAYLEGLIARCWAEVLGVDGVGVDQDYYDIGGDSLAAILIANSCRRMGVRVTPRAVLTARTVAALAATVRVGFVGVDDMAAADESFQLAPSQAAGWALETPNRDHWNQAALFEVDPSLDVGALRAAIELLVLGHPSLRLAFDLTSGPVPVQRVRDGGTDDALWTVDLSRYDDEEVDRRLRRFATAAQCSLDLAAGSVLRVVHVTLGPQRPGRLLVVVHQLAFDVFSWPVLTGDLVQLYRDVVDGVPDPVRAEPTPFSAWVSTVARHGRSVQAEAELPYWLAAGADPGAVPLDHDTADLAKVNLAATGRAVELALTEQETAGLLRTSPRRLRCGAGEVVLWALGETLAAWSGADSTRVDVLGHGREEDIGDVDLSRTTGWFTTVSPLRLDLGGASGTVDRLLAAREQWRALPCGGVGYGALRTYGVAPGVDRLRAAPDAFVSFDYLGKVSLARPGGFLIRALDADLGAFVDPGWQRPHAIEVQASIVGGRLRLTWVYSTALHDHATIGEQVSRHRDLIRGVLEM